MWILALRTIGALTVAGLLVTSPSYARAQEVDAFPVPLVDLSAGYTFMREFERRETPEGHVDFPAGWYLSGAANLTRWFGIVAESSGSYKNEDRSRE
jgi:hypothetical protein